MRKKNKNDYKISLILLSCIVVLNRDLANTLFSFITDIPSNSRILSTTIPIDIETNIFRGKSTSASLNSFREFSMSSMAYMDKVQVLASSLVWADQVEDKRFQDPSFFYATAKERKNNFTNLVLIVEPTHILYEIASNDMNTTHSLEPTVILYTINQPIDPQLQDSNFYSISIFGINEYLEGDTKNITYLLHRIVAFVRQCKLEDKTVKNIS